MLKRRCFIYVGLSMCALTDFLSGCGGGGNSSSTFSAEAEGFYQGTTSNSKTVNALVLEDGSLWNIYGVLSATNLYGAFTGDTFLVEGLSTGTSNSTGGIFSATIKDFHAPGDSVIDGQESGNYVSGSSLNGTIAENGIATTFTLAVPVQMTYNYNTPASIGSISGTWSGWLLNGETATITIAANGLISGASSLGGCAFSGTATPRPSGKNVFNVSLTFGNSPCVAANQTVSGIGLTYPLSNGRNQLIFGLISASHSQAIAFGAER